MKKLTEVLCCKKSTESKDLKTVQTEIETIKQTTEFPFIETVQQSPVDDQSISHKDEKESFLDLPNIEKTGTMIELTQMMKSEDEFSKEEGEDNSRIFIKSEPEEEKSFLMEIEVQSLSNQIEVQNLSNLEDSVEKNSETVHNLSKSVSLSVQEEAKDNDIEDSAKDNDKSDGKIDSDFKAEKSSETLHSGSRTIYLEEAGSQSSSNEESQSK